jgi:aspartate 1-decarboxylase
VAKGDIVIILSYCQLPDDKAIVMEPTVVYVDEKNRVIELSPIVPLLGREM